MAEQISVTIDRTIRARVLQAAIKDGRSFSQMVSRLCELGLPQFWGKFEPSILDAEQFLEVNKKAKSNDQ